MPIPKYHEFMFPLLKKLEDGKQKSMKEISEELLSDLKLSEAEKTAMYPSGNGLIAKDRVSWARTYLKQAGLIISPNRGMVQITDDGMRVLKTGIKAINAKYLEQFPDFLEVRNVSKQDEKEEPKTINETETPDELLEEGYLRLRAALASNLLERLKANSPAFFEQVVLDLLTAMGYGKGRVTGRSGDGGVDGLITQDKLGLDTILFQAKRFKEGNPVSASMVRDFVGTLELNGVSKGVFITTSRFPRDAENLLKIARKNIVIIDGQKLVDLMIDHDLGVTTKKTYQIKDIDTDYFTEE